MLYFFNNNKLNQWPYGYLLPLRSFVSSSDNFPPSLKELMSSNIKIYLVCNNIRSINILGIEED